MKTLDQINSDILTIKRCDAPVWSCVEEKRIVRVINHYRTDIYGTFQFKPQCLKCGRIGTAKSKSQNGCDIVDLETAKKFEEEKRQQRKILHDEHSAAWTRDYEQKIASEKSEWRSAYEAHLQSDRWRSLRKKVFDRDNGICQGCGLKPAVQAHHLTYKRLGNEMLFDLISVCLECHNKVHENT